MNRKDLIEAVAAKNQISKEVAKNIVESVFVEMNDTLNNGESVSISGFGNFMVIEKPARVARNPRTGEKVDVPAHKSVKFKIGKNYLG